ncbi:MAG: hypothetical protein ABI852_11550 [Gemmatimonadaceae bacterium]
MTDSAPLRIGLMLDSHVVPAWVAAVVRDIANDACAEVVLVVMHDARADNDVPQTKIRPGIVGKVSRILSGQTQLSKYLYQKYSEWDQRRVQLPNDPNAQIDIAAELATVDHVNVVPITDRFFHRFQEPDLERIRAAKLNVMLRFGFNIIKGPILESAQYGVWSFHHGDNQHFRGGPAYFWELYRDEPLSGIVLQVLSEKLDAGRILYRSYASTERGLSMKRNGASSFWKGSSFVIRRLRQLHTHGWEWMKAELPTFREDPKQQGKLYRLPTNGVMVRFFIASVWRNARKRLRNMGRMEHWFVAHKRDGQTFIELASPRNHYYADPFVVARDGRTFIFLEDYDYKTKRGTLAHVEVHADNTVSPLHTVLDLPYHLSYPFVFELDNKMYMIPESASNKTVDLYEATSFPDHWTHVKTLQSGIRAYDVTLLIRDGVYWWFASVVDRGTASCDELFLFYSASLTGDWTPHPLNPIVSDVRRARPAGKFFERDGKLIRPSQDCSLSYGGAMQLNEVLVLNKTQYVEQPVSRIDPDWMSGLVGTHTINQDAGLHVLDGRKRVATDKILG